MKARAGEIHLWSTSLDAPAERVAEMRALLSEDELARAAKFHFEKDRTAFILARGFLRTTLSRYVGGEIKFGYGPQGKPALTPPGPHFNLSHTKGLALLGVTLDHEIGVDVEYIRPMQDREDIARRFFSPSECADLISVDPAHRDEAFFHCWTRKEAYIKALGGGLSIPLDSFQVTLKPGDPPRFIHPPNWFLLDIPLPGYAAAAVGQVGNLRADWQSASTGSPPRANRPPD